MRAKPAPAQVALRVTERSDPFNMSVPDRQVKSHGGGFSSKLSEPTLTFSGSSLQVVDPAGGGATASPPDSCCLLGKFQHGMCNDTAQALPPLNGLEGKHLDSRPAVTADFKSREPAAQHPGQRSSSNSTERRPRTERHGTEVLAHPVRIRLHPGPDPGFASFVHEHHRHMAKEEKRQVLPQPTSSGTSYGKAGEQPRTLGQRELAARGASLESDQPSRSHEPGKPLLTSCSLPLLNSGRSPGLHAQHTPSIRDSSNMALASAAQHAAQGTSPCRSSFPTVQIIHGPPPDSNEPTTRLLALVRQERAVLQARKELDELDVAHRACEQKLAFHKQRLQLANEGALSSHPVRKIRKAVATYEAELAMLQERRKLWMSRAAAVDP